MNKIQLTKEFNALTRITEWVLYKGSTRVVVFSARVVDQKQGQRLDRMAVESALELMAALPALKGA